MFQYLLEMILPADNNKSPDELCIDDTNTMSSDENWLKIFHSQLAELNKRTDEAQKTLAKPKYKKHPQKDNHK